MYTLWINDKAEGVFKGDTFSDVEDESCTALQNYVMSLNALEDTMLTAYLEEHLTGRRWLYQIKLEVNVLCQIECEECHE